ncbi:HWE histidine kinase domain-containing protein [Bradyrhizobium sp. CCH5-F6]|jgi:two-component sensor histidine kinase/PAS domain-containing protein|uniref:sensor histidine kinase n=1 Tax=Bradyrhizobium sp. CCH5-F6 TaxID=1768753 RepID=UPI00076A15CE|nr:HWE histidine kinase domain-containing protein [Bradyrhizobium sp. CCH5-F6]
MSLLNFQLPAPTPTLFASFLTLDQAILDALPIGVYACNVEGQIVRVNHRAVQLWGRAPKLLDAAQKFCGSFRVETLDGDFIPPEETPMARAVLTGQSFEGVEAVVHNPDGRRWVARVNVAPLRDEDGEIVGGINCFLDVTHEHEMRVALERQQRTFDLAMIASRMGTWRYTLADNVCIYDRNAQALYGLTEARFFHDEDGVKTKFHPDDMELMWARVAKALDPKGDGRYEVEYRVKQRDGSWRWLSAWGLVEFEGEGAERRPLAIAGASRDLSELKQAEELQRLLTNELNHRVKNTLATVQSIVNQTLRGAADVEAARRTVNARLLALAGAHDLLTARAWAGADLADLVTRVIAPFPASQILLDGPSLVVLPTQALALSLALHELATNAAKYGALSRPEGRVEICWIVRDDEVDLSWRESGGPLVASPSRRGFGSRLIEHASRDMAGRFRLEFDPSGVRCRISAALAANDEGERAVA